MDERELIKRAQKLIRRYDNMKIVGSRGEWSGSARQGFAFNPVRGGGGSGGGIVQAGACCLDGNCFETTEVDCVSQGGTYQGNGTDCDDVICPTPETSPCCFSDGHCEMLTTEECINAGGHPSDATNCDDPNICLGGCCDFFSSTCSVTALDDCDALSGNTWIGYGTDCTDVDCTCCPFFTFYTTLKFSGSVSGRCNVTFPEQTWTKVFPFPSSPGAHEFAYDTGCIFAAGTCDGTAANTYLLIDSDGTCDTDTAWMTADFGGACGPFVLFTVNVNDCDGGPIQVGGDEFKDFSSGSITIVYVVDDITATFNLTASE